MEPPRAIWHTEEVRAAVEAGDLGAVVRGVRRASHLTLADLARRCGYSVSTLSRLERGKQPLGDVRVLRVLVEALRVPPALLGLADTPRRSVREPSPVARVGVILMPGEEADPMRRRTLLAGLTGIAGTAMLGTTSPHALAAGDPVAVLGNALLDPSVPGGLPVALPQLRQRVAAAQSVFQLGRYTDVAARLPDLLSTATATRDDTSITDGHASANAVLSELYALTSELMIKLGDDRLAWTTADRALQASHGTDDVLTRAAARRAWAIVLRRAGHADTAQRLVVDTATALQPDLHRGPEYLSVYGSLLSTAAYTAAVDGDRDAARGLLAEAVGTADRLGADANHRFTPFGPTAVGLYRISIARVLGDFGPAVEAARRIDAAAIPLAERRARYWSDVARSFHHWGKPEQCYRALLAAERAAPDEVRYRKPIQQITTSLLRHPSAHALPGLRAFATRTGTPV